MQTISINEVKRILDRHEDTPVINVLPPEAFRLRHIPGSINVPLQGDDGESDFPARVEEAIGRKDGPLVVYCASTSCNASPRAARALEEAGFSHVHDLAEGVAGWQAAGYPLRGAKVRG